MKSIYLWSLPSNSSSRYSSISWIFVLYLTLYAFWKILLRLQNFPAHSYGNGISEWRHWRVKNRQMSAEPSVTKVHEISFEIRYFLLSGHFSSRFWDTSQSRNSKYTALKKGAWSTLNNIARFLKLKKIEKPFF